MKIVFLTFLGGFVLYKTFDTGEKSELSVFTYI